MLLVAAIGVAFGLAGPFEGLTSHPGAGGPVAAASGSCAAAISNSTLLGLVDRYYQTPNASLSPDRSAAENHTLSVWATVCGSAAFVSAYSNTTNRTILPSVYVGDQNRTANGELIGSLFASFTLSGVAGCPAGASGYPAGYPCQETDSWTANLSRGTVTGHRWSVTSDRFVPCLTPEGNQTNLATVAEFYPNPSQRPSESTARAEITVLWSGVCTSVAYYDAYWAHGENRSITAWTTNGAPNATSSDLFVSWGLYWGADPCPRPPPSGGNSTACEVTETWTADLGADSYSGPTIGYGYAMNGSGAPPFPGNGSSPGSAGGHHDSGGISFLGLAPYLTALMVGVLAGTAFWYRARGPRLGRPSTRYASYATPAKECPSRPRAPSDAGVPREDERDGDPGEAERERLSARLE